MPPSTLPASAYEALELPTDTVEILTNPKPNKVVPASDASPNLLQNACTKDDPLALNESTITLYAELLLNIRTITLFASLRTFHTRETKAQLSADGSSITISHEGESATIRLPIKVQGGGDATLSLPASPPSKDLTLRLQMEEKEGTDFLGGVRAEERKANLVPWDGASLNAMQDVELVCKACHEVLVKNGTITEWRDLPNENWAEMMDFWHCHKPDEHHLHNHTHETAMEKKGYAAGNRLQALPSIGFVDLASLLFKEEDCQGVQVGHLSSEGSSQTCLCKSCKHVLGTKDTSTSGWRINKWNMGLTSSSPSPSPPLFPSSSSPNPTTYPAQKWISARLLSLIENSGARKFHIHPRSSSSSSSPSPSSSSSRTPSLLVWVFTPDLVFSSSVSSTDRKDPTRCMKVFYEKKTWAPAQLGEAEAVGVEEVEFEEDLFGELEHVLRRSAGLVPSSARKWMGWDVGLLERFGCGEW
ncbi:hypothetical protein K504DRAFT_441025 [Pleomassaria siparia CBS 279.74]|uniref:Ubiquitin-conjugating enzyme E2-binding protein n=1 Tax=Pleomassaria siparia CBS 279.74 TaxID=1314801 RepID=A0A6G1JY39_9PLEO|nr:hypothetical protein K504DRAFT_441025 [Pleomassaria siparia CBS 279.74]